MDLTETYDVARILLGDFDAVVQQFSDTTLRNAARAVVRLGKVSGLALSADLNSVSPEPTTAQFALLSYWMAKLLITPTPDGYSYRSRAFSERFGHQRDLLGELGARIHELENGEGAFAGWQSYYCWLLGFEGLPVGGVLTDVNIRAPFYTATITRAGAQVSGGGGLAATTVGGA